MNPIIPLSDRLVIEPIKPDTQTKSGLYLPESGDRPQTGKVLAAGPGKLENGKVIPMTVEVGHTVLFAKYTGAEIKYDDQTLLIIRESDVLGIVSS